MKRAQGIANGFVEHIVGVVSRSRFRPPLRKSTVFVTRSSSLRCSGHRAVLSSAEIPKNNAIRRIANITSVPPEYIENLHDGDIVCMEQNGQIIRLWDLKSRDNIIFMTNHCDCKCLACPQPSDQDPDGLFAQNRWILTHIKRTRDLSIAFTGGEPTLNIEELVALLKICRKRFPSAAISLLTNGRRLSNFEYVKKISDANNNNLTYCVSIYGDVDEIHDLCVGAKGAFQETVRGLHNLARLNQKVEIRVVIIRNNYRRLLQIAEYIYRNFPFALHITFMGMESTGRAWDNIREVWVDPFEYVTQLRDAIQHLNRRYLHASIYNLPFCLLPRPLWRFSHDSISDWKKSLLPICDPCVLREKCAGFFATSHIQSSYINPILDRDVSF